MWCAVSEAGVSWSHINRVSSKAFNAKYLFPYENASQKFRYIIPMIKFSSALMYPHFNTPPEEEIG